ncbi:short-chain dehydrogenase, putative [Cordyceps militaris CM01]|uniref:Short-chain dehydrogenase, putative n=1 Tax=Cordyceps militaris (strain CM01) TaxID=983644 RepID=G3JKX8_CORMM|nr:short-chain dehydrogenase, putative [Cordyceps militaris CM01]EGX90352.1 short-chain dehydrogenase, putative [Cordyceps militaris CM01]
MSDTISNVRARFELTGRTYIVTGGAQGIGFALSRAICEMGGHIAVWDIQPKPVAEFDTLHAQFGAKTLYIQTDVTQQDSLEAAFAKTLAEFGTIDGCVPAAGIAIDKPFVDQTWDEFNRIQEINVRGTFFTVQLVAKELIKQKKPGSILLIASQSAHIALPGYRMAAYNASKGGVLMLARVLGVELAPHGIRVNTISPGFVDSEMTRNVRATKSGREGEQMWRAPPNQRLSRQDDLTGAAVYLLSDASVHTTAADIAITGGLHAGTIDGLISYE